MDSGSGSGKEAAATPLLEKKPAAAADGLLNRLIDVAEAKEQAAFALPMILTNFAYYFIPLVSVMFAGHLGELELAGSNLANSWAAVTGFSFMVGLSGSLETLCGQGFGAKMYRLMGVYLQTSCILSLIFTLIVSVLWWYSDIVLTLLHQEPQIANSAGLYLKYLIPGLFAYGILQNMLRFLQTQSVVMPLVVCSMVPLFLHVGITYALMNWTTLGFRGAPLAASISLWISAFMLGAYLLKAKKFEKTWDGFTTESFSYLYINLKLALPSAAMVCLEYWAFEILVLLAGLMPNSEITTSLIAMCVNTEAIAYMIAYGLSAAASTRVSNELGAGNPDRARHAMSVTLKLTVVLALATISALAFGHNLWASSFSNSPIIIDAFASMTPFLVISILCDFIQGILSGVARGCGWQHLVVFINLGTFYLIGMVVAALLGFMTNLHAKVQQEEETPAETPITPVRNSTSEGGNDNTPTHVSDSEIASHEQEDVELWGDTGGNDNTPTHVSDSEKASHEQEDVELWGNTGDVISKPPEVQPVPTAEPSQVSATNSFATSAASSSTSVWLPHMATNTNARKQAPANKKKNTPNKKTRGGSVAKKHLRYR